MQLGNRLLSGNEQEIPMRIFKPVPGCLITASAKHQIKAPGEHIGICTKVDENICVFTSEGNTDRFIWQFSRHKNDWYTYQA